MSLDNLGDIVFCQVLEAFFFSKVHRHFIYINNERAGIATKATIRSAAWPSP